MSAAAFVTTKTSSEPARRTAPPAPVPADQIIVLTLPTPDERAAVHRVAGNVARGALEVLAGSRQAQQLVSVLDPAIFRALLVRAELTKNAYQSNCTNIDKLHQSVRVNSVHSCWIAPGIYELSIVVAERLRCRALALRIEKQGGNWKVTALLIG